MTDALGTAEPGIRHPSSGEAEDIGKVRHLLEHRAGRTAEDLLDEIARMVGSPRRFARATYQKPLG